MKKPNPQFEQMNIMLNEKRARCYIYGKNNGMKLDKTVKADLKDDEDQKTVIVCGIANAIMEYRPSHVLIIKDRKNIRNIPISRLIEDIAESVKDHVTTYEPEITIV